MNFLKIPIRVSSGFLELENDLHKVYSDRILVFLLAEYCEYPGLDSVGVRYLWEHINDMGINSVLENIYMDKKEIVGSKHKDLCEMLREDLEVFLTEMLRVRKVTITDNNIDFETIVTEDDSVQNFNFKLVFNKEWQIIPEDGI